MKIIAVSGYKGGTGKTTIAALIAVAAALDGAKVGAMDLDRTTRNLASFLKLRRQGGLATPELFLMAGTKGLRRGVGAPLAPMLKLAALSGLDLMVIDTSSGDPDSLYEAHLLADVIVTPMNDSPADLHGLFTPSRGAEAPEINYRDMIDAVRFDRRRAGRPVQKWHAVRNRVAANSTRIGDLVEERLRVIRREAKVDGVWTVRDRVAHRAICHRGRTVFDAPEKGAGGLSMSEIAARSEIRLLVGVLLDAARQTEAQPASTPMLLGGVKAA